MTHPPDARSSDADPEADDRTSDAADAPVKPAEDGAGPFLQRDYWAILDGCDRSPCEVAMLVREDFFAFPPPELVAFRRIDDGEGPLEVGDCMEIDIRMVGETGVRVIHADESSVTLATLEGHPEAGRITFGAYRSDDGDVIFHIRSRARAGSAFHYAGFVVAGQAMQTNTWTEFIDRLAQTVGDGVAGAIHVETQEIDARPEDEPMDQPTYVARAD